jgi:hypothetical protein
MSLERSFINPSAYQFADYQLNNNLSALYTKKLRQNSGTALGTGVDYSSYSNDASNKVIFEVFNHPGVDNAWQQSYTNSFLFLLKNQTIEQQDYDTIFAQADQGVNNYVSAMHIESPLQSVNVFTVDIINRYFLKKQIERFKRNGKYYTANELHKMVKAVGVGAQFQKNRNGIIMDINGQGETKVNVCRKGQHDIFNYWDANIKHDDICFFVLKAIPLKPYEHKITYNHAFNETQYIHVNVPAEMDYIFQIVPYLGNKRNVPPQFKDEVIGSRYIEGKSWKVGVVFHGAHNKTMYSSMYKDDQIKEITDVNKIAQRGVFHIRVNCHDYET